MSGKDETVNGENCFPVEGGTKNTTNSMTEDNTVNNKLSETESDNCLLEKDEKRSCDSKLEAETVNVKSNKNETIKDNTFPDKGENAKVKICTIENKTLDEDGSFEEHETASDEKDRLIEKDKKPANFGDKALEENIPLLKIDAMGSEENKSVDRSDNEEHADASCGTLSRKKNIRDNSLNVSEVDSAPTRTKKNTRHNLSEDVIPEHSPMKITENTKSLENRKLSPISRALRSKSLDPRVHMSVEAKGTSTSEAASRTKRAKTPEVASRTKLAQTPEVKLKTEVKVAVRSSPRKAAKSTLSYREESRKTPTVLTSRSKMSSFKATSPSSSVGTLPCDTSLLKEELNDKNTLKMAKKINNGRATSAKNISNTKRSDAQDGLLEKKLIDQSHNEEHAHSSHGASTRKTTIRDKSLTVPEDKCALSRTNIRYNLSEDAIPENSMKITENTKPIRDRKLSPISRSLRSKSLEPPAVEQMLQNVKPTEMTSRKKRAQTPEVKLKTEVKHAVRSSPRKAAKSATPYKEESRKTPSVLTSRPKMSSFKATPSSSSVATLSSDTNLLKETLSDQNELKIDGKIKDNSAASGQNEIVNIKSSTTEKNRIVKDKRLPYAESHTEDSLLEDSAVNDREARILENIQVENEMRIEACENNRIEIEKPVHIDSSLSEKGSSVRDTHSLSDAHAIVDNENLSNDQPKDTLHEKEAINVESALLEEKILGKGLTLNNEYLLDTELNDTRLLEKGNTVNDESTLKEKDETVNVKSNMSHKHATVNDESTLLNKDDNVNVKNISGKNETVSGESTSTEKDEIVSGESTSTKKDETVSDESTSPEKDEAVNVENSMFETDETVNVENSMFETDETVNVGNSMLGKDEAENVENSILEKGDAVNVENSMLEKGDAVNVENSMLEKGDTVNVENSMLKKGVTVNFEDSMLEKDDTVNFEDSMLEKDDTVNFEDSMLEKDDTVNVEDSMLEKDDTVNVEDSMLEKDDTVNVENSMLEKDDTVNTKNNMSGVNETVNIESALLEKADILYETSSLSVRDAIVQEQNFSHAQPKNSLFKEEALNDVSAILEEKDYPNSNAPILEKDEMRRNDNISDSDLDHISLLEKDGTVNAEISLQEKEETAKLKNMSEKDKGVKSALSDKGEIYDTSSLSDRTTIVCDQNLLDTQGNDSLFEKEAVNDYSGLLEEMEENLNLMISESHEFQKDVAICQNLIEIEKKKLLENIKAVYGESVLQDKDETVNAPSNISEKDEALNGDGTFQGKNETVNAEKKMLEKDETNIESTLSEKDETNVQSALSEKDENVNAKKKMPEKDETNIESALSEKDETLYDTSSLSESDGVINDQSITHTRPKTLLEKAVNEETALLEKKIFKTKNYIFEIDETINENFLPAELNGKTMNCESTCREKDEILNVNENISEKETVTIDIALSEKGDTLYETSILSDKDPIVEKQNLSHTKPKNSLFEKEVVNYDISLLEDKETLKENLNSQNGIAEKEEQAKNKNVLDADHVKSVLEKDGVVKSGSAFKEKNEIVNVKNNMSEKNETLNIDSALLEKVETLHENSSLFDKDDKEQEQNLLHTHPNNEKGVESDVSDVLEERETLDVKSSISETVESENVSDAGLIDKNVLEKDIAVNRESASQEKDETLNAKNNMSEINETVTIEIALSEKCDALCEGSLSDKNAIVQEQNVSNAQQKDSSLIEPVNDESALLEEKKSPNARHSILEKDKQIKIEKLSDTELNEDETVNGGNTLQENKTVNFKSVSEKNSKVEVESVLSEKSEILHDTSSLSDRDGIVQNQNLIDAQQNDTLFEKEAINDEIALLEVKEALNVKSAFLEKEKIVIDENLLDAELNDKNLLEKVKVVHSESTLQETDKTVNCKNNMSEKDETVNGERALQEETVKAKNNRSENETIDIESEWSKCETLYDTSSLSDRDVILQNQNLSKAQLNNEKETVNESVLSEKENINVSSSILEKETVILNNLLDAGLNDKSELEKVKTMCAESTFQKKGEAVNCKSHVSEKDETMNGESALQENAETINVENNISGKETVSIESVLLEKSESLCDANSSSDTDAIVQNPKFPPTKTMINSFEKWAVNDESGFLEEKEIFSAENYIQEKDDTISENLLNVDVNDESALVKDKTMNVERELQEKDKILNVKNNVLEKHDTVDGENLSHDEVETVNIREIMLENEDVNSVKILPEKGGIVNVVNCMPEDERVNRNLNDEVDTYLLEKHETGDSNSDLEHATVKVESEENDTENENTFAAKDENGSTKVCMIKNKTVNSQKFTDAEDVSFETVVDEKNSLAEKSKKPANFCGKDLEENIGLSKIDDVKSEEYKSVDQSDGEEHADASSCGSSECQNARDNSLTVSEVDCAPTRSRRNIRHNLSKDVIPEHSIMRITENTKSLLESELSLISRSSRSKSLDPPTVELMSDDAKEASSRKKRAQTPEVKLKTEAKIAVRSSPRKAAKSILSYREESRRIPKVLTSRPKMSSFKATSSSSSVATEKLKHSDSKAIGQNIRSSKIDAVESEEYKSVDRSDNKERAHTSSYGASTRKKNIRDNRHNISEVDSAPTRTRRNIRHNISKDVIPEHSIVEITENTKSLTDTKLKPLSRSVRAKSLDPPVAQQMSDAASSRKKRAQTPEVKLKAEETIAVRSSPRKAVKPISYREDLRKTPSVSTSSSKMSATSSNSGRDTVPSVASRGTKKGA